MLIEEPTDELLERIEGIICVLAMRMPTKVLREKLHALISHFVDEVEHDD